MLTDGKRVSVINAPAGSGKTRVMTEAARLWAATRRGPVIGITPSQSARNTLAAGVAESYNTAQFLGHLPGQRGARGPIDISEDTLLLVDESSMIPTPDLSDLVTLAGARSAKMVLAGDTEQLQAVENGGATSLLASALGYVRLPDPVRFRAGWEQAASLRLRTGDASVLAEYDQHGRIIAGEPEQMTDAAAAAYIALTPDGTEHTGLAVITGTEDRQHAYVALTRGTDTNTAYVFTLSAKIADPGPRPAPELARYDRLTAERDGEPVDAGQTPGTGDALGVLSDVLERDGQQLSALQTQQQALPDADHLAILHAIWTAETTPAREQSYRKLLMDALPPEYRQQPGHQARWLWRTLRAAELAGLDPAQALATAIGEQDLTGARDLPSVIDARLRQRVHSLVPLPPGSWCGQVPDIADPERGAFAAQIADMMDARKVRIGEHAAENSLPWAVTALGPVPEHPLDRLEWQRRASSIGAYRELSGHDHPTEPIGPEPIAGDPDKRAAWHEAFAALGPVDGPDVRGLPDGTLLHLRDTYPIETAWAPKWVGDALR